MTLALSGVVAAFALVTLGCAAAPRERPLPTTKVGQGPDSLEGTRRALEGTWALQSLDLVDPAGTHRTVKASGTLTYDAFGGMKIRGVVEDPAVQGTLALDYEGRIVIDNVRHEYYPADLSSDRPAEPGAIAPVSPDKVRRYELNADSFVVTYIDAASKPTAVARWRRSSAK